MYKVVEEYPNHTSPFEMEECVNDKVYDKNERMMRKKRKMKQQIMKAPHLVKVKELTMKEVARMLL